MKATVTKHDFIDAFLHYEREHNFSYEGRSALFDYIEELEEDTGEEMELDIIGICCDFSEYKSAIACIDDCGYNWQPDADDRTEDGALEYLRDNTSVVEFDCGIIIQDF